MNISEALIDIRYPRLVGGLCLSIASLVVGRMYLRMDKLSLAWDLMSFSLSSDIFCWVAIQGYKL
jgi:hypothetical protein